MTQNFSGRHPLKWLPHPSYCLHIAPSAFYLFGKAKSALIGQDIPDEIHLPEAVTGTLNCISYHESQRVFQN
jgi:hypothetical protein